MYGNEIPAWGGRPNSVIGEVTTSNAGNLVIRVGKTRPEGGWEQTEHLALSPTEARDLVVEITERMGWPVPAEPVTATAHCEVRPAGGAWEVEADSVMEMTFGRDELGRTPEAIAKAVYETHSGEWGIVAARVVNVEDDSVLAVYPEWA